MPEERDTPEIQSGAEPRTPWPHAPVHRLSDSGTYMVSAGTYKKEHHFRGKVRLRALHGGLLKYAAKYQWLLESWAVFSNHYHFIAHSPEAAEDGAQSLATFLAEFHQKATGYVNGLDNTTNRKVWHNFWETQLTFEKSYFARLNYVHQNAVKHGLVPLASQYPWCSAGWFEREATGAQVKTIYGFKTDQLKVLDEFEPVLE
jgi:putative transposase